MARYLEASLNKSCLFCIQEPTENRYNLFCLLSYFLFIISKVSVMNIADQELLWGNATTSLPFSEITFVHILFTSVIVNYSV